MDVPKADEGDDAPNVEPPKAPLPENTPELGAGAGLPPNKLGAGVPKAPPVEGAGEGPKEKVPGAGLGFGAPKAPVDGAGAPNVNVPGAGDGAPNVGAVAGAAGEGDPKEKPDPPVGAGVLELPKENDDIPPLESPFKLLL